MSRYRIELVTAKDCQDFVNVTSRCPGAIVLESSNGFRINAKSLIGAMASMEWEDLYCVSDRDIYGAIQKWIVNDENREEDY